MKKIKLTPPQELFCQLYASQREYFGNGTQAYLEAYGMELSDYKAAAAGASRLLKNVNILSRIDQLLGDMVMNDQYADKQLGFWMSQKDSPQAAIAAIKEYNALKQRVTKKLDLTTGGDPLEPVTVRIISEPAGNTDTTGV